jgi:hypothetical protein
MEIMAMARGPRSSECSDKIKKGLNAILRLFAVVGLKTQNVYPLKTVNQQTD